MTMATEGISKAQSEIGPYVMDKIDGQNVNMGDWGEKQALHERMKHLLEASKEARRSANKPGCRPHQTCIRDLAVAPKLDCRSKSNSGIEVFQILAHYAALGSLEPFLFSHVWHSFLWGGSPSDQTEGDGRGTNNGHCGTSQDVSTLSQGSNGNSKKQRNKRGGGDPPNRRNPKRRSVQLSPNQDSHRPQFACPFYLRDKATYFPCLDYKLHRVGDVRQHITRAHIQKIYCPRCGIIFEDRNIVSRDHHLTEDNCEVRDFFIPPGITDDEVERMRSVNNTNNRPATRPDAEKWFEIWDSLFLGIPRPASPYLNVGFSVTSHLIEEYQDQPNFRDHVERLLSLVPGQVMREEAFRELCNLFNDMSLYSRQRIGGSINYGINYGQGSDNIPRDVLLLPPAAPQSPINSNGTPGLSTSLPQSIMTSQDPIFNSAEDGLSSISLDENIGVDSFLFPEPAYPTYQYYGN